MVVGFVVEAASFVVVVRFERMLEAVFGGGAFGILVLGASSGIGGWVLMEILNSRQVELRGRGLAYQVDERGC